jgi:hypothetical protein
MVRKRTIDVEYPTGKLQSVIRYVDPDTDESFAVVNNGNDNCDFVRVEPISNKKYQVVDIVNKDIL